MKRKIPVLVLSSMLLTATSWAGVILTYKDGSRTYIDNGRIKHTDQEAQTDIFDTRKGLVTLIEAEDKAYAQGTVEDFCEAGKSAMQEAMSGMSPEEKAMMEQMMKPKEAEPAVKPLRVSVSRQGSGGKIAGFNTEKYQVTVDGEPYEELWLSDDPALVKELGNMKKLSEMASGMASCMGAGMGSTPIAAPEDTAEYQSLYQKGFPIKIVPQGAEGEESGEEVVKVEKGPVPDAEFQPPADYRKVPFTEFMK